MNRIVCSLVMFITLGSNAYHIDQNLPNAQTYHDQQDDENAFKYGYQVEKINDQFQHKQKGPDDVTYGCFGHSDPEGRKRLTFFVADRLGYRVVLTGQPTTVYPVTSASSEVSSGVSGGKHIAWKDLPFPVACQADKNTGSSFQLDGQGQRYDEAYVAESRNAFQRTLLERPPADQTANNLGNEQQQQDPWLQAGSSNNNAVINAHASSDAANPADKGQAVDQSRASDTWRPFLGTSNSFMLSSQCDRTGDHPGGQTLTLYIPFRIACSDMQEFEAELAKLTARFNRAEC